jgi:hypothetical protein
LMFLKFRFRMHFDERLGTVTHSGVRSSACGATDLA